MQIAGNNFSMQRILAVDDDKDILDVLQYILEDSGYAVETLSDGSQLMQTVKENQPDLILLDIMLGNMDGRVLCKKMKSLSETENIPVILISASHDVSSSMYQQGAPNAFIAKPFDIHVLLNTIKTQLAAA